MVHIQTFGHIPSLLFYLGRYFFSTLENISMFSEHASAKFLFVVANTYHMFQPSQIGKRT